MSCQAIHVIKFKTPAWGVNNLQFVSSRTRRVFRCDLLCVGTGIIFNESIMGILGLDWAPLNVPLRRRLQTLAAFTWFIWFVLGGFVCALISVYLVLFSTYLRWPVMTYLIWYNIWDRKVSECGGRKNEWVRNWSWWKYVKEYFPASLQKLPSVKLDPKKNYLFCCFPHGLVSTGIFAGFGTNYGKSKEIFPDHESFTTTLGQHFDMPFFREQVLAMGGCKASAKSMEHILSKPEGGNICIIVPGGAAEAFYSKPRSYKLIYNRRKGFIKIALKMGSPLVPVVSFGETDIFDQVDNPEGSKLRKVQEWLKTYIGLAPAVPIGRGFFQYNFGLVPYRKPIYTIVGKPLEFERISDPTIEEIDELHEKFKQHLIALFEEQKHNYLKNADKISLEIL